MRALSITKPGIIFGNIVTLCGGFFLGSAVTVNWLLLLVTIIGMALVIACGCILNNVIDRDIDRLMERTKNRVLAQGLMSNQAAVLYALVLGLCGLLVLYFGVNLLTTILAVIGLFFYVGVYTLCLKRYSVYGTLIGGIAGAIPPVAGYTAATNRLDNGAWIAFLILFLWQMPHFYAIAIYRLKDFSAASVPVLPIKRGIAYTKISMVCYIILFIIATMMPTLFGYTGWDYLVIAVLLGLAWLIFAVKGFYVKDDRLWARKVFLFSILVITVVSVMMLVKV